MDNELEEDDADVDDEEDIYDQPKKPIEENIRDLQDRPNKPSTENQVQVNKRLRTNKSFIFPSPKKRMD